MPKAQLTNTFALTAGCETGKKRTDWWCTHFQGLVLECRASGGKTWYLRFFDANGRQKQYKICRYGDLTVEQVRKEAKRLRSIVVLGGDPLADKVKKRSVPTYAELAQQHLDHSATYLKRPGAIECVLRVHILPRWGKMRLDEITSQDIAQWLATKAKGGLAPATIDKIRVTMNRSFELAGKWSIPGGEVNPVRNVPRRRYSNARERYLSPADAVRLQKAVAQSDTPQLPNIVGLLLLTGARKTELLQAQWQHIDLDRQAWFIPDSKTGRARHVPLAKAAMDIINELPRWPGCPWLLPNPLTLKPYVDIKRCWDAARDKAGLEGLRLHDLRHSAASFMCNAGVDLFAVGRILGHADHKSTMRYSHLANDTLRRAVEAGAANLNIDWTRGEDLSDGL